LRLVREAADQVLAPQLRRIEAHLARRTVDQPLDEINRLGAAGAAVGHGRRGVGEDEAARHRDRGNIVNRRREL
jgi:hypothetical protein